MSATIPDLWPDDIRVDLLTPLMILRMQAGLLSSKTQGLIIAEVRTTTTDKWVQHQLDLIALPLDHYRVSLLTARHDIGGAYPVTVRSQGFVPKREPGPSSPTASIRAMFEPPPDQREAATQEEFIDLVRQALRSDAIRSRIQSLIVRTNEARPNPPLSKDAETKDEQQE